VSLGGVRQKDNYNLEVDSSDTAGIIDRCYKLWPVLKVNNELFPFLVD